MVKTRVSFGLDLDGVSHRHAWSLVLMELYHSRTHFLARFRYSFGYIFARVAELDFNRYFWEWITSTTQEMIK